MNSLLSGLSSPMMLDRGFETTRPMFRYPESAYKVAGRLLETQPPALAGIGGNALTPTAPPNLFAAPDASDESAVVPLPSVTPRAPDPAQIAAAEGQVAMSPSGPLLQYRAGRGERLADNSRNALQRLRDRMVQTRDGMKQTGQRMTPGIKALGQVAVNREWLQPVLDERPNQTPITSREFIPNQRYGSGRYA